MKLYQIQHYKVRSYYVVAASYGEAVEKWKLWMAKGDERKAIGYEPHSVTMFCDDRQLVQ